MNIVLDIICGLRSGEPKQRKYPYLFNFSVIGVGDKSFMLQ